MSNQQLQSYIFSTKYARFIPELKRRETFDEAVTRVCDMHRTKFAGLGVESEISFAEQAMKDKLVVGSQRAMQFGGEPILKKEARLFNCTVSHCDRPRFFQEAFWLLLCGCGTGFSVQRHHVAKLPSIAAPAGDPYLFVIPDTIEGWADAVGVLLSSYFTSHQPHPDYAGHRIEFDFSAIRAKGTRLSSGSGKAPGPEPLKRALEKIRALLERCVATGTVLRPIDAYDIVMHASDAVLSGGVRRSATIALFSPDDTEMTTAKTGNWFIDNPQRGRSNNSALLLRGKTKREDFDALMTSVKEFGEPGFVWTDDLEVCMNPCQPASAPVVTEDGLRCFADIQAGDRIWSKEGWTTVIKKWKTGTKKVYRYDTSAGFFLGTEHHCVVSGGVKVEVGKAESIEVLRGPTPEVVPTIDPQDVIDGLVLSDGTTHEAGGGVLLCVGANDTSYGDSEIARFIGDSYGGNKILRRVTTTVTETEVPLTYLRRMPTRYTQTAGRICGVLRGVYSANGSCHSGRVTLKASSHGMIQDVQLMLSSIGIRSYVTINKANAVEFSNGTYTCRESYDLNIRSDIAKFERVIGFIQPYKQDKLRIAVLARRVDSRSTARWNDHKIIATTFIGEEDVFDITVDNASHTYWTGGHNVSNCVEVGMLPTITKGEVETIIDGVTKHTYPDALTKLSGWQMCNLSEINMKACDTVEKWERACRAAAILGTLQAAYTSFPYLGEVSEAITRREALLGVSMTGMMDTPELAFDPVLQRQMAQLIITVNEGLAKRIGIRSAARATVVKPSGTTSCLLGTASGIHPHHSSRYFRHTQANKLEAPFQHFAVANPESVEDSVWTPNGTDGVIAFCIEVGESAVVKEQVDALKLLEYVKTTKLNWVDGGRVVERCAAPFLAHNVSNTITVRPDEWGQVAEFIWDNQSWFAGISLLPDSGDLDYPQAPFVSVWTQEEMEAVYGKEAVSAVSAYKLQEATGFSGLWAACDVACGVNPGGEMNPNQQFWLKQFQAFASWFFKGDAKLASHCIKRVYNWQRWLRVKAAAVDVDYTTMVEHFDDTKHEETISCAGGKCDII